METYLSQAYFQSYNLFILLTVGDLSVEPKMLPRKLVVHIMGGALKYGWGALVESKRANGLFENHQKSYSRRNSILFQYDNLPK